MVSTSGTKSKNSWKINLISKVLCAPELKQIQKKRTLIVGLGFFSITYRVHLMA